MAVALSDWYKNNPGDLIWWRDNLDKDGEFLFSFDRQRTFNFFADYPQELTPEQKAIFDRENPKLANLKAT